MYDKEFELREKSNDLLFEAYETSSKTKAKNKALKALEIWPDNIDAMTFIADLEPDLIKRLKLIDEVIDKAVILLDKEGFFSKDYIGIFWGVHETRPYMRAMCVKTRILEQLSRFSEAILVCEEMLRLCKNDNLGIRYVLINYYVHLERFDDCEKLYKTYNENSSFMLFAMAICYYKKGEYKKCKEFIKNLNKANKHIYSLLLDNSKILDNDSYSLGSKEEASDVVKNSFYLINSTPSFIDYMGSILKNDK